MYSWAFIVLFRWSCLGIEEKSLDVESRSSEFLKTLNTYKLEIKDIYFLLKLILLDDIFIS